MDLGYLYCLYLGLCCSTLAPQQPLAKHIWLVNSILTLGDNYLNRPSRKPRLLEETQAIPSKGDSDPLSLPLSLSLFLLIDVGTSSSLITWVNGCNWSQLW